MEALRELVLAETTITALVSDRVYVHRIPRAVIEAQDTFHPAKMVVLRPSGGFGKADLLPTDDSLVTVLCYGESDYQAGRVRRAVWQFFVELSRVKASDGTMIHHLNPTSGAVLLVDDQIVWPAVAQSYTVKADVLEEVSA